MQTHVLKKECDALNTVFFHYITTGTPYVVMKYAMTMDGKIACHTGESKWVTGEEARACIEQILPYVDIFFCSEDTARLTFGKTGTIEEIQKSFCEEYPISVVASTERTVITPKKHNFTSIIYSAKNDSYYREEPYNNIDVVDRIGSGDAYVSGALYGYLKHKDCRKALEYGNAMAAIKHSVIGDMITTDLEEIDSIIAEHKNTGYHSEMNR